MSGQPQLDEGERIWLLRLARAAIEARLRADATPVESMLAACPPGPGLARRCGVFVTLKLPPDGAGSTARLRGCIGTLDSDLPLPRSVASTAPRAAFEDPRFAPLTDADLLQVTISLSVLGPQRPIVDPRHEIRIGTDGVVLVCGVRRALFLPQVAVELGWDIDQLLEQLARKAGLDPDAWRAGEVYAFETEAFEETVPGRAPAAPFSGEAGRPGSTDTAGPRSR